MVINQLGKHAITLNQPQDKQKTCRYHVAIQ